jgi:hypothetical protein
MSQKHKGRAPLYGERMQGTNVPMPTVMRARADAIATREHMARTEILRLAITYGLEILEGRPHQRGYDQ